MTGDKQRYPPISDYGLIGDMHSCALVSRSGSIDWCCFPRFDSPTAFGRLLDWDKGGCFDISLADETNVTRRYLPGTNILETRFETRTGVALLKDFMPVAGGAGLGRPRDLRSGHQIVRMLQCISGTIHFEMMFAPRFDYGAVVPHPHLENQHLGIVHGGGHALWLYSSAALTTGDGAFTSEGVLRAGERLRVAATYTSRRNDRPPPMTKADIDYRLAETELFWEEWASVCTYDGPYRDMVLRSALALKLLTYAPSGALVAAATTSLPAEIGGVRNWDYRYTWIRDATFALYALALVGYREEVHEFKEWIEWSTLGRSSGLQLMYGLDGERRLSEQEIPELEGYRGSRPVRIGNGAYSQFQLDIYGELLDSAHIYRKVAEGLINPEYWDYLREVLDVVIARWQEPDEGLWETRGGRKHFVFSKVMCWVALDRAIRAARDLDLTGDIEKWEETRDAIRADVLEKGYDREIGSFVQSYGSRNLDASALLISLMGFMPATDPMMRSTIAALEKHLTAPNGTLYRYRNFDDGLEGTDGTFTICSFWLADNIIQLGELDRARALFEDVMSRANDVGLFSEQLDPKTNAQLGNFPQAFSHLAVINTAVHLWRAQSEDSSVTTTQSPLAGALEQAALRPAPQRAEG